MFFPRDSHYRIAFFPNMKTSHLSCVRVWAMAMCLAVLTVFGASGAAWAVESTFSGDTTGQPTFNRPDGGQPPTRLSGAATAVPFLPQNLTITTEGSYTFVGSSSYDGYGVLYVDSFDPAEPLTNALVADDDSGPAFNPAFTIDLIPGNYIYVATSFSNDDFGPFTVSINGPAGVSGPGVRFDPSGAEALVVTTDQDVVAADGLISLREAIGTANAQEGEDFVNITFDTSVFAQQRTITLTYRAPVEPGEGGFEAAALPTSGTTGDPLPPITRNVDITGPVCVVVEGRVGPANALFSISNGVTATVSRLAFVGSKTGVRTAGTFLLTRRRLFVQHNQLAQRLERFSHADQLPHHGRLDRHPEQRHVDGEELDLLEQHQCSGECWHSERARQHPRQQRHRGAQQQ
jgi:hypothetical protein